MKIDLVDVKAQYAPLIPELKQAFADVLESGKFVFGPNVAAFETEAAEYLRVPRDDRRRQRHRRARARARRARHRPRRRGHLPRLHLLRDRRGDRAPRGDPGVRRHRSGHAQPRSRGRGAEDHARRPRRSCPSTSSAGRRRSPSWPRSGCRSSRTPPRRSARRTSPATGIASTFSFYPTKNLFGLGDGGLVAARDAELADRIRMLRFHGSKAKKTFEYIGYNSRLDEIQAAALRIFLRELDGWTARAPRGGRPLRRARPGRALSRSPPTSRATSTTSSSAARPSATASAPR